MKKLQYKTILIALLFTLYSVIILALFNPFQLISSQSLFLSLIETSGCIFVSFIGFEMFSKLSHSILYKKIIFISSFFTAPLLTAIITFYLYSNDVSHFTIYVSSFIVFSLLPLSLAILYTIFEEVRGKITISSEVTEKDSNDSFLKLINDNGKVLLNIRLSSVICFEANDNYVITYFKNSTGEVEKSMERISLKKIEEILIPLDANFQRVHKSYIVNPNSVTQVQGKAQSHKLKLNELSILVPVSRNFDVSIFQGS